MHYDPVKDVFASVIRKFVPLRILFYKLLDMMFLRSWYVRRELLELRKLFGTKKIHIFDAGTGYGQYAYFMGKNMKPNIIKAVDVKEQWINDCKVFFTSYGLTNVEFNIEDLTTIQHENEFDLIVCVDVMEHISDDVKVFSNFYRALKKGGYLLINTPSIYGGSDVHDDHGESFIGEHERIGYSYEDFVNKLSPLGFTPHRSFYTYGFWGDKAWRLGIKFPMLLVNVSKFFILLLPLYFIITLIPTLIMMKLDMTSNNEVGSGIIYIAKK